MNSYEDERGGLAISERIGPGKAHLDNQWQATAGHSRPYGNNVPTWRTCQPSRVQQLAKQPSLARVRGLRRVPRDFRLPAHNPLNPHVLEPPALAGPLMMKWIELVLVLTMLKGGRVVD